MLKERSNWNPFLGKAHYLLGDIYLYTGRSDEGYDEMEDSIPSGLRGSEQVGDYDAR